MGLGAACARPTRAFEHRSARNLHLRLHLQWASKRVTGTSPTYRSPVRGAGTIHLVVACTERKSLPVAADARVRTLLGESLVDRVSEWTERLNDPGGQRTSVERLYAGDHWHVAKSARGVAPVGIRVRLWICSAGYGLLSPQSSVRSYGATFAPEHPDSVVPRGSQFRASDWWDALTKWSPSGTDHRSISGLADEAKSNGDFVLVAMSQSYLRAVGCDISVASSLTW